MVVFNPQKKEIDIKVVYYGPALCGKTTNLKSVHLNLNPQQRGELISLATKDDRTLFFDFLPIQLDNIKGFKTRFHIYTVPGQVFYTLTRKAVLTGVDGVIFVADSQASKMKENIESLNDLKDNLKYYNKTLDSIPFVLQYNKRDLPDLVPISEMNKQLNLMGAPYFEACALNGQGVMETLTMCCRLVLQQLKNRSKAERTDSKNMVEEGVSKQVSSAELPELKLADREQKSFDPAVARDAAPYTETTISTAMLRETIRRSDQETAQQQRDTASSLSGAAVECINEAASAPKRQIEEARDTSQASLIEALPCSAVKTQDGKNICPRCSLKFKPNVKLCPICRIALVPENSEPDNIKESNAALPLVKSGVLGNHANDSDQTKQFVKDTSRAGLQQIEIVSCDQPLKASANAVIIPMIMKCNGNNIAVRIQVTISVNDTSMQDVVN